MSRFPQPPRELLRETPNGKKVYLVDGKFVRERIWLDFTTGGNHMAYPFIPKGEIWVDDATRKDELDFTILHEDTEDDLMQEGWGYEDAHFQALLVEMMARRVFTEHKLTNVEKIVKENKDIEGATDE